MLWFTIIVGIASIIQAVYAALNYHQVGTMRPQGSSGLRRPYVNLGVLVILVWGAVAFHYYDRHYVTKTYGEVRMLESWGVLPGNQLFASVQTRELVSFAEGHYLVLLIRVENKQIDQVFDQAIEKSTAFLINGDVVTMEIKPSNAFLTRLGAGGFVQYYAVMLPRTIAIEEIRSLHDVGRLGGQLVAAGGQFVLTQKAPSSPPA